MSIWDILREMHSGVRWLVVGVSILAALKFLVGWLGKQPYRPIDRGLMSSFVGLIDLNVLLGLIFLVGLGFSQGVWPRQRLEHGFIMLLASGIAHGLARWRTQGDDATQFRNSFLVIVITMVLVVVGVSRIGGWG